VRKLLFGQYPDIYIHQAFRQMLHSFVFVLIPNICFAIPEGKKCFAWFTSYKKDIVCFILEITNDNKIADIKIVVTSFTDKLALGTIFYGTLFLNNEVNCFAIEDIYYNKGKQVLNESYLEKINILKEILSLDLAQTALTNNFIIFGLPFISYDFNLLLKEIELLPYKVNHIKFRLLDKVNAKKILYMNYFKPGSSYSKNNANTYTNSNSNSIINKAVFKVTADVEPDIYNLFMYKNGKEVYFDIAHIPDYKTSVMMNKLFRNIKENDNLDRLEESDNEEEFQDCREDKFVYLDRSFKINCEYNSKFRKWCPISLADNRERIVLSSLIK
jgi:hypothetical protein